MKRVELELLLENADLAIRAGDIAKARTLIDSANQVDWPRPLVVPLARILRRSGRPAEVISLLRKYVRSEKRKFIPEAGEAAEYGAALNSIGALHEGHELLKDVDAALYPLVDFYQALGAIQQWDYLEAKEFLEAFLKRQGVDQYQRLVAKINLASCYLFENNLKDFDLLSSALEEELEESHLLLKANLKELRTQAALLREDLKDALSLISEAESLYNLKGSRSGLVIDKWRAVILGHQKDKTKEAIHKLKLVRESAEKTQAWNTVRDCDLQIAILSKKINSFRDVYIKSPFRGFRERVLILAKKHGLPEPLFNSETYQINLGPKGEHAKTVDVTRGSFGTKSLKTGQAPHRMLIALSWDLYRPQTIPSLFGLIFPNQFYNPETSALSVHQAMRRLRLWLASQKCPLKIQVDKSQYSLSSARGIGLVLPTSPERVLEGDDLRIQTFEDKIRGHFGEKHFRRSELEAALSLSGRSARRMIAEALARRTLGTIGSGPQVRYRLNQGRESREADSK